MQNILTIVMYHYVRELPYTNFPKIKGLLASQFEEQLIHLAKYYQFITTDDCIDAISSGRSLPPNAILLTFDDGYIDHYLNVFPILEERGIQGCFFPSAKAILKHQVLDINKIHFILHEVQNTDTLLKEIFACLDKYRKEYSLESNDYYFLKLAKASRYDSKEIMFAKQLLQFELKENLRHQIVDDLFKKHVTKNEEALSRELYMNIDQLKCMARNGMYIGSHGYTHYPLDTLSPEKQEQEIDLSLDFLKKVGSSTEKWVMCYPSSGYNASLIEILKRKKCQFALTTNVGLANMSKENAFTLKRLDTNDFPKTEDAEATEWTKKVLTYVQNT
jgi:peptidoglycan/xylan/chitin deacetylase (PgdA/CDA1 family)